MADLFISGRYQRRYLPVVGKVELVQPHAAQNMLWQILSLLRLHQDHTMFEFQTFSQGLPANDRRKVST
jgi:hypothetical protein